MEAFVVWLQGTPFAQALGGEFLYPAVNVAHVLGIALLFGAIAVLDLRLMGVWRGVPLAALSRPTVRVAGFGLGVALLSGAALFAAQAGDYIDNPYLYVKLAAVAAALVNLLLLHRSGALTRARDSRGLALAGAASLLLWLAAIVCGRLIAYW